MWLALTLGHPLPMRLRNPATGIRLVELAVLSRDMGVSHLAKAVQVVPTGHGHFGEDRFHFKQLT